MKKTLTFSDELLPLLPDENTVKNLKTNWLKTLTANLSDLFTYESDEGIERYDIYKLREEFVLFLVNELNKPNSSTEGNVKTISIIMGKGELEQKTASDSSRPTNNIFIPILEVVLKEPYNEKNIYYLILEPQKETSSLLFKSESIIDQQISPKVAELLMINWKSLTDGGVINAFEGLAADSVITHDDGSETGEIIFRAQKIRRVRQYNFDHLETQAIINKIKERITEGKECGFFLNLGAGLIAPDFHPFNFRPIIKIVVKDHNTKIEDEGTTTYYDTSRPCPPFCDPS